MSLEKTSEIADRWNRIVREVADEMTRLPRHDLDRLAADLDRIAGLKRKMHQVFVRAGGVGYCGTCLGACCGSGRNHPTLIELLTFLCKGENFPRPDFRETCPFLDSSGCMFPPERRPFNCVVFLCETIESRLSAAERRNFRVLEKDLRSGYSAFENRFAGASLRGLLIRGATLNGRPFLGQPVSRDESRPVDQTSEIPIRSCRP